MASNMKKTISLMPNGRIPFRNGRIVWWRTILLMLLLLLMASCLVLISNKLPPKPEDPDPTSLIPDHPTDLVDSPILRESREVMPWDNRTPDNDFQSKKQDPNQLFPQFVPGDNILQEAQPDPELEIEMAMPEDYISQTYPWDNMKPD